MYIILKGLVLVQIVKIQYDIREVIATLKDGDAFGELALIDIAQITGNTNQPAQRRKRAADCITIENSWVLRLEQKFIETLTQMKKKGSEVGSSFD